MHSISGSQPGVRIPLGVREKVTGGTWNLKKCWKEGPLGRIFDLGVRKKAYNSDLGVRLGVKFWFGGMRLPKGWEPLGQFIKKKNLNNFIICLFILNKYCLGTKLTKKNFYLLLNLVQISHTNQMKTINCDNNILKITITKNA